MSAILKLKTLESNLQMVQGFEKPKVELEQYETPAHIAAVALHTIQSQYRAIEGRSVMDAGCGAGMLSVGAVQLGASSILAADIDADALTVLQTNIEEFDLGIVEGLLCDVLAHKHRWENCFDTVLMNPPFGTKHNAGVDMKFLRFALDVSSDLVFSLHKSTTRSHIQKKVKEWAVKGKVIAELRYDLPATYRFHKQRSKDIAVDLWMLHHPLS